MPAPATAACACPSAARPASSPSPASTQRSSCSGSRRLAAAEGAWLAERGDRELDAERRAFIAERRRETRNTIAALAAGGALWWLATTFSIPLLSVIAAILTIPLIVIGVITFFQAWGAIFETEGEDFEKAFDKWLERRETRRARLAPPGSRRRLPPVD